jgi:uncharacterized membrane protein
MRNRIIPWTRSRWRGAAPLAGLLLLGACELQRINTPEAVIPSVDPPAAGLQRIAEVAFEVDPLTGAASLSGRQAQGPDGGARTPAVPVTYQHVEVVDARCVGCQDQILDNQRITVRFVVKEMVLAHVDLERVTGGDHLALTTCVNCRVRSAELRGASASPLHSASVGPGEELEVVLHVDALQLRPFTVHFQLVASTIDVLAAPSCRAPGALRPIQLLPPGATASGASAINNRGEVLVSSDVGSFLWSATAGYRAIPREAWRGVNDQGQLFGVRGRSPDRQAVFWPGSGEVRVLPLLPGQTDPDAAAMNNVGTIVGSVYDPAYPGVFGPGARVPIVWEGGIPRILSPEYGPDSRVDYGSWGAYGINDRGDILGSGTSEDKISAMVWENGQQGQLINSQVYAIALNNVRQAIFGNIEKFGGDYLKYVDVWSPPDNWVGISSRRYDVRARAINDHGVVVGYLDHRDDLGDLVGPVTPFRWSSKSGVEDLPLPDGSTGGVASDVNEQGQVVGTTRHDNVGRAVLWSSEVSPMEALRAIESQVQQSLAAGRLTASMAHALSVKLRAAARHIERGEHARARGPLGAFANQVAALVRSRRLGSSEGQTLRDAALCLRARL